MAKRIVYERKDGSWGWKLRDDKGGVIAAHGNDNFTTEVEAREMADRVIGGDFKDADKRVSRRTS